jgi:putative transposase
MRPKGSAEVLESRRRLAVQRVRDGHTVAFVAQFLGVTERSVYRWLAAARDQGDRAGLNPKPHLGPQPRLDIEQQAQVIDRLGDSARLHGFATDLWTAPRVARLIEQAFRVPYHPRHVNHWLRERGVRALKPRRRAREQDPQAVARWLDRDWPTLLGQARQDQGWLVFVDEAGLLLEPLWRRTQAPRGRAPVFDCPAAQRRKVSALAALAFSPARHEVRLLAWTIPNGYFNAAAVAGCLGEVLEELNGTVRVVWDRGTMHKGPAIRAVAEGSAGRLSCHFLPAYTPEANPVEQLWSLLKYSRLNNVVPRNVWHLDWLAGSALVALEADPHLLLGCFKGTILPHLPDTLTLAA